MSDVVIVGQTLRHITRVNELPPQVSVGHSSSHMYTDSETGSSNMNQGNATQNYGPETLRKTGLVPDNIYRIETT